jgi:hypothetical protein
MYVFGEEGRMYVPWCGWCIDVETLEVQSDFSRYQSVCIHLVMSVIEPFN